MPKFMEEPEENDEVDAPLVDKSYISQAQAALSDVEPQDFSEIAAEIPAEAEDGTTVAMLITGTVENGVITSPVGTLIDLSASEDEGDEVEEAPKLKKLFKGATADDEA